MADPRTKPPSLYDWPVSITFAVAGTVAAVALIVIFTELVDWVGDFWSQVIYFVAIFGGMLLAAQRSRASDSRSRRGSAVVRPRSRRQACRGRS